MEHQTAQEAFYKTAKAGHQFGKETANFICPYCRAFSNHTWGNVHEAAMKTDLNTTVRRSVSGKPAIALSICTACDHEAVYCNGRIVYPPLIDAPLPTADMPDEVKSDFQEARTIYNLSPRGAAALLRLVIQKLCPLIGSTAKDINLAIGELVKLGKIPQAVQQALDTVRVIGNEAVHPGTLDLKDDQQTARSLFGLVNFIVERAITEPKSIEEIYSTLPPNKLAGIANRDGKVAKNP